MRKRKVMFKFGDPGFLEMRNYNYHVKKVLKFARQTGVVLPPDQNVPDFPVAQREMNVLLSTEEILTDAFEGYGDAVVDTAYASVGAVSAADEDSFGSDDSMMERVVQHAASLTISPSVRTEVMERGAPPPLEYAISPSVRTEVMERGAPPPLEYVVPHYEFASYSTPHGDRPLRRRRGAVDKRRQYRQKSLERRRLQLYEYNRD